MLTECEVLVCPPARLPAVKSVMRARASGWAGGLPLESFRGSHG